MFEWTIIGGGIQGSTLATYLIKRNGTSISNLAIIDPHREPLFTWKKCTKTVEMPFLRSPSIHHLDVDPFSLEKYAKAKGGKMSAHFYGPYDRPSLSIFNEHCDSLFEEIELKKSWIQGRVNKLQRVDKHWLVTLMGERQIKSKNVVLAMGLSDQPCWPGWASELKVQGANIHHIYDNNENQHISSEGEIVIIGGGISAIHTALKWSNLRPGKVKLLTRHPLRTHQFDSDPGWLGPKKMKSFEKVTCLEERRKIIANARFRGSIPQELKMKVISAGREGRLELLIDNVSKALYEKEEIVLELEKTSIRTDHVLLATGFHASPPGIEWLQPTIEKEQLHCANCGYPIVSEDSLQWGENLYVMGALAELVIGPVSRNISGARRGAERIVQSQMR
ncbi:FAD/NAD(P)-binding protein [Alkalihalobacillus sp. MEB130]|uniref:FAD/NAD(P)-binding protein n=1 Tax=Alkalihalobacillus sp. MEB130 TaxID=2976704 RepID=UPI0028DD8D06|nr:FAD/NAD(P)-binding protein [Alkalihalobacillus sp. MEB130]MDT8859303.1 FAD/NAD(P)-binding protein [Alkalihalobacillus sp. MEB130]